MKWPKVGSTITPLERTEVYYSGYRTLQGRNPVVILEPGEPCRVRSVDVPPVYGHRSNFLTAEFTRNGQKYTVALWKWKALSRKENP